MALTMGPYLFAYSLTGINRQFGWFSWLGYNLDDGAVYLSWIRQAADGHFFQRNLFTTEPQPTGQFNLFFLALGLLSRVTTLDPIAVWHIARIALGFWFLYAVYRLIERLLPDDRSQKSAFLLVCFSAGLGWIPGLWKELGQDAPVDVWQPEAITFLSLYLNPLFIASQLLMVGFLTELLDSERTGSVKAAGFAGFCGFLLGNIHGYDVITLAVIWTLYRTVRILQERGIRLEVLIQAAAAFVPAFLSAGYQYYLLRSNPVFAARVNVETLSPPLAQYLMGYGLLVLLAIGGAWLSWRRASTGDRPATTHSLNLSLTFLISWAIANLAAAYLPVPFQRKMVMGLHLPICMLAGAGVGIWLSRLRERDWRVALVVIVGVAFVTNARFQLRDAEFFQANLGQSLIQRPFLMAGERKALEWLREHAKPGTPIQPLPWIPVGGAGRLDTTMATFAPGLTGLPVAAGHWGETPAFGDAIREWNRFTLGLPVETAAELLRRTGVRYITFSQKLEPSRDIPAAYTEASNPLLRRIPEASNADAEVFEVLAR